MRRGNSLVSFVILVATIWVVSSLFSGNEYDTYSDNGSVYDSSFSNESYDYEDYYSEPENPYDYGTGHSAGYEWAEENDVDYCDGNSQSFIEGCEEYLEQRDSYEYEEYDEYGY